MLLLGVMIGLWIGAPLGMLILVMMGPAEPKDVDPRSLRRSGW